MHLGSFGLNCAHLFLGWLVKRRYRLQAPQNHGPLGCKREYVRYARAREMKATLCYCARTAHWRTGLRQFDSVIHRCKTRWREAVPAICLPGAGHLLATVALTLFHYSLSPRMGHVLWIYPTLSTLTMEPAAQGPGEDLSGSANDCVLPSTIPESASCGSSIEICSGFLKACRQDFTTQSQHFQIYLLEDLKGVSTPIASMSRSWLFFFPTDHNMDHIFSVPMFQFLCTWLFWLATNALCWKVPNFKTLIGKQHEPTMSHCKARYWLINRY